MDQDTVFTPLTPAATVVAESSQPDNEVHTIVFTCPVDHLGTVVHVKGWTKETNPQRPLIIVHDFGENLSFYRDAALQFVELGFNVYVFDLQGHGRSGRMLGHVNSFSEFTNDLLQVSAWVRHKSGGHSPIILGQGIGALVTIYFQLRYPHYCYKAILSAPTLKLQGELSNIKRMLIRTLADVFPRFKLPRALVPKFSNLQVGGRAQSSNPKYGVLPTVTAKFTKEILRAIEWAPGRFLKFNAPTLILCPNRDKIVNYSIVDELLLRHKHRSKFTVKKLDDAPHALLADNSECMKISIEAILSWLQQDATLTMKVH
jgi:alpha-beta hydrolase superfamily lysophospholipase